MTDNQEKAYRLRIPEALYAEVEKWAEEDLRSVNGQIVMILRDAVAKRNAARVRKTGDVDSGSKINEDRRGVVLAGASTG